MRLVLLCCGAIGIFSSAAGHAAIYRCINSEGHHTYTDRPCPGQQPYAPTEQPLVTFTPIAETDRARLQAAQQRDQQQRQVLRRARTKQYKQQMALSAKRQALCSAAINGLQALQAQRRKGYSLAALRQLDAKEAAFKLSRRQHC